MDTLNTYIENLFKLNILKKSDFKEMLYLSDRQLNYFLKTGTTNAFPDNFLDIINKDSKLTPEIYLKIVEAYEVSKCGETATYNKELVHKLLKNFTRFYEYNISTDSEKTIPLEYNSIPLDLLQFIDNLILHSTDSSCKIMLSTNQTQEIGDLVKCIINILYKYKNEHIQIEHIFNWKNWSNEFDISHNLDFLDNIVSFTASYENYYPYFYTVTYTQERSYNIFPNIILINNTLIYISEDFKTWFYINEQKAENINQIIYSYKNEFEKSKLDTKPFIKTIKDIVSFQKIITDIENSSMVEYEFRRDLTCYGPPSNMSIDWFDYDTDIISENNLNLLIQLHNERMRLFENKLAKGFKITIVCCINSIQNFLSSGKVYDQGGCPPVNINKRLIMLQNLYNQITNNPSFSVYFIKEHMQEHFSFIEKLSLYTNGSIITLSIIDKDSEICKHQPFVFTVILDSPELSNCFSNYIELLIKTAVYSREDSLLKIKEAIDKRGK